VNDTTYQQNVAEAIASGLISWRSHAAPVDVPEKFVVTPKPKPAVKPAAPAKPVAPKPAKPAEGEKP
jgi:hypothetical protein